VGAGRGHAGGGTGAPREGQVGAALGARRGRPTVEGKAPRRGTPRGVGGDARGRRNGRGERERGGEGGSSPWGSKNPAITVTGSPRARGGRERGGREGEGVVARKKQMRQREREEGHAWGEGGALGARRVGPD
jgi:hypothetical protein